MLYTVTRYDVTHNAKVTRIILANLNHEYLIVRKYALHLAGNILKQQKRQHKKIEINPREGSGDEKSE